MTTTIYEDATNKKAWLYKEYNNNKDLIDHLFNDYDYDEEEVATRMDHYLGCYKSEESFIDSWDDEEKLDDVLLSSYYHYNVNGNYHFFLVDNVRLWQD